MYFQIVSCNNNNNNNNNDNNNNNNNNNNIANGLNPEISVVRALLLPACFKSTVQASIFVKDMSLKVNFFHIR